MPAMRAAPAHCRSAAGAGHVSWADPQLPCSGFPCAGGWAS